VNDRRRWLGLVLLAMVAIGRPGLAAAQEIVFDVKIENGRVPADMRLIRIRQGDNVRLHFTSDKSIDLHLHGYDIELRVEPGKAADMAFTARAAGRFPVEQHKQHTQGHSHGDAPLVRIEVRPR
jgi:translation initiation factor IF-1